MIPNYCNNNEKMCEPKTGHIQGEYLGQTMEFSGDFRISIDYPLFLLSNKNVGMERQKVCHAFSWLRRNRILFLLGFKRKLFSLVNRILFVNIVREKRVLCKMITLRGVYNKFPDFFVWALLLIVQTWNTIPLRSNLLQLQCTSCTVPKTSGRSHGSPLVWACQWPSPQPLSSPQLASKLSEVTGSKVWTIGRLGNCLDVHLGQIVCDKDGVVDWCIVLVEMPLSRFEEFRPLPKESLTELP